VPFFGQNYVTNLSFLPFFTTFLSFFIIFLKSFLSFFGQNYVANLSFVGWAALLFNRNINFSKRLNLKLGRGNQTVPNLRKQLLKGHNLSQNSF